MLTVFVNTSGQFAQLEDIPNANTEAHTAYSN